MHRRTLHATATLPWAWRLARAADDDDAAALLGPHMPYTAFDKLPATEIKIGATTIRLAIVPADARPGMAQIVGWAQRAAHAIARYYGRLPNTALRILVISSPGSAVHGTTWGYRGPATRIRLGRDIEPAALADDWVLVHEMVHMSTPQLPEENNWLTEGLAVYIEPIARAQSGIKSIESVWAEMIQGMPKGEPRDGDQGLDRTHTWGRTYWGGAMFCLLADVEIRSRTGGKRGLQDALRAIVAAGGSDEEDWSIDQLLASIDRTTGVDAASALYARQKDRAVQVDLDDLWHRLGVSAGPDGAVFDDAAPLAAVRRGISTGA